MGQDQIKIQNKPPKLLWPAIGFKNINKITQVGMLKHTCNNLVI